MPLKKANGQKLSCNCYLVHTRSRPSRISYNLQEIRMSNPGTNTSSFISYLFDSTSPTTFQLNLFVCTSELGTLAKLIRTKLRKVSTKSCKHRRLQSLRPWFYVPEQTCVYVVFVTGVRQDINQVLQDFHPHFDRHAPEADPISVHF